MGSGQRGEHRVKNQRYTIENHVGMGVTGSVLKNSKLAAFMTGALVFLSLVPPGHAQDTEAAFDSCLGALGERAQ